MSRRVGIIERYERFLPVSGKTPVCSLLEGSTPLIPSVSIGKTIGVELFFKYEGLNPTGSFKDRGMTMAISKALEDEATTVICASTGNTSASAAAYASKAGMKSFVLIPKGKIALGKLAQAIAHGATVLEVDGNFDEALSIVREIAGKNKIALVNSLNPYRLDGQKTAAFEVCDDLDRAPDYLTIPVGNAGNITAYWMGFQQYYDNKKIHRPPIMLGFQAEGAAPIVQGHKIDNPETIATAIRIGNPARWREAEAAARESGGLIDSVTDDQIIEAYKLIASTEGIFVEAASAASIAGLLKMISQGRIEKGSTCVAVLTGHGLKDPETAIKTAAKIQTVPASVKEVERIILG